MCVAELHLCGVHARAAVNQSCRSNVTFVQAKAANHYSHSDLHNRFMQTSHANTGRALPPILIINSMARPPVASREATRPDAFPSQLAPANPIAPGDEWQAVLGAYPFGHVMDALRERGHVRHMRFFLPIDGGDVVILPALDRRDAGVVPVQEGSVG